jgi:hypothetical protein
MKKVFASPSLMVFAATAAFTFARPVAAQAACGDSECPKGYECRSELVECPTVDCRDGAECPPCEPTELEQCVPLPCTSDDDCAQDMACASREVIECPTSPPCESSDDGDAKCPPDEGECTKTSISECVPRWVLPCTSASDCGAGFTCEEDQECGCSGSSGSGSGGAAGVPTPGTDAGASEPVPEDTARDGGAPDCTCVKTGTSHCAPIETACTTDADCETGWTCRDNPESICSSSRDGTTDCEVADPARLCFPPHADLGGGRGVSVDDEGGGTSAPGATDGDSSKGESGATSKRSEGGCSVASAPDRVPSGLSFGLLGALSLLGLRRRAARR